MDPGPRVAILISGRGSNMVALVDHAEALGIDVALVVSSRASAPGLALAAERGVPTVAIPARRGMARADWDAQLQATLDAHGIHRVVLAGFMRILTDAFVAHWHGRIVNIHPSLLPAFPGLHPHQQALDAGVCITGCTVHLVAPGEVDGGTILAQSAVPVHLDDDADSLADRVLAAEHALYPETVARWVRGDIVVEDGRVVRR